MNRTISVIIAAALLAVSCTDAFAVPAGTSLPAVTPDMVGMPNGVAPLDGNRKTPIKNGYSPDTLERIVGTTSAFGIIYGTGNNSDGVTDYGQTTRQCFTANGTLRQLKVVLAGRSFPTNAAEVANPNTIFFQDSLEYPVNQSGQVPPYFTLQSQPWMAVPNTAATVRTDWLAKLIPAGQVYCIRHGTYVVWPPATAATGAIATPATALVSGGVLPNGVARYYKVTAFKNTLSGVSESGPSGEATCTPASTTLSCQITWVASPSVPPDGYNIYEGSSSGAEKFQFSVSANSLSFIDTGYYPTNAAASVPTVQNTYPMTSQLYANSGGLPLATTAVNCTGSQANLVANPGVPGLVVGPSTCIVSAPLGVLGDDITTPSVLALTDSIGAGYGTGLNAVRVVGAAAAQSNWVATGVAPHFPLLHFGIPGNFLETMANSPGIVPGYQGATMRMSLIDDAQYVFEEDSSNDLYSPTLASTWQTIASQKIAICQIAALHGKTCFISTTLPRVADTGIGLTLNTQSVQPPYEAQRVLFNSWACPVHSSVNGVITCSGGLQVDGSGNPVQSGGTATPYIAAVFDAASALPEVNSAGVPTVAGGLWPVPTTPTMTGQILSGAQTTATFTVSGAPYIYDALVGLVIQMTSGVANGQTCVLTANSTNQLYCTGPNNFLANTPASGDTFQLWGTYEYFAKAGNGGIHTTSAENAIMGAAFNAWVVANFRQQ